MILCKYNEYCTTGDTPREAYEAMMWLDTVDDTPAPHDCEWFRVEPAYLKMTTERK